MKKTFVGIGHFKVAKGQNVLETLSLGSCIGVVLHDSVAKVGGLAHIMLPDSSLSTSQAKKVPDKYADTAIPLMIKEMIKLGAKKARLTAKIVGGANMFRVRVNQTHLNIGDRNVEAVQQVLAKMKIPLLAEDIGKNYGRTVKFEVASGRVIIKSSQRGEKEL